MNLRSLDWKFFLSLSIGVLGVVGPLVWQADLSSKGLEVRLRSSTSIEPSSQIRDLQLVLDGKKLDSPYSSSLELVNTGSKTVLSKDFATPIEIVLENGAQIVTARVTSTSPSDIPVKVSSTDRLIQIAPHLSNSSDSISLSVITSGEKPSFTVRGRIAEVQQVAFADLTLPKPPYIRYLKPVANGIGAWALFCLNVLFMITLNRRAVFGVPVVVSVFGGLASYIGGTQLMLGMVEGFDLKSRWEILLPLVVVAMGLCVAVCAPLSRRWMRYAENRNMPARTVDPAFVGAYRGARTRDH